MATTRPTIDPPFPRLVTEGWSVCGICQEMLADGTPGVICEPTEGDGGPRLAVCFCLKCARLVGEAAEGK